MTPQIEAFLEMMAVEPERRILLREAINEWLERKSAPGFPASTLGL